MRHPGAGTVGGSYVTTHARDGSSQTVTEVDLQANDNLGNPVNGASVTVQFSGDFGDTLSGTTGPTGSVTLQTATSMRKPNFSACVATLSAPDLTYTPGTEAC